MNPSGASSVSLLVVVVDHVRLGLPLSSIVRAMPACALSPLPGAPEMVAGAVNLQGRILAVLDLRRRLGLPPRPVGLDDHLLVVDAAGRRMALLIDDVGDVFECPADAVLPGNAVADGAPAAPGLVALCDGLLIVEEPERFLDEADLARLGRALAARTTYEY